MTILREFLDLVARLWRTGNRLARVALGLLGLWPFFLMVTAFLGSPTWSATVGLMPLIGGMLLLLTVFDPLIIAVVAALPAGRKVLVAGSAVIAIELLMAVYFAAVPIYHDPGLAVVLMLALSTFLFLALVKHPWARRAMKMVGILILALTIIFFLGGRREARESIGQVMKRVLAASVPPPTITLECGEEYRSLAPRTLLVAPAGMNCWSNWMVRPLGTRGLTTHPSSNVEIQLAFLDGEVGEPKSESPLVLVRNKKEISGVRYRNPTRGEVKILVETY